MKKILFIGTFGERTQGIAQYLSGFAEVQICSDNVSIAAGMLGIFLPDLVLVNLEGFSDAQADLFDVLGAEHSELPVVLVGSSEAVATFSVICDTKQYSSVTMNETNLPAVLEEIMARIDLGIIREEDGTLTLADVKKTILVVDDSPVILRSMKQILDAKYVVMLATSGLQALAMIEKRTPDLVILDYEMPECDGKETLEKIRAREEMKETPVVFLTGHGDAGHISSVLDLKPSGYFVKPPQAEAMMELLEQLLGS